MMTQKTSKDPFTNVLIWTVRVAWLIAVSSTLLQMTDFFTQSPFQLQHLLRWLFIAVGTLGMYQLTKMLSALET